MRAIGGGLEWIKLTAPKIKEKKTPEEVSTQNDENNSYESLILSSDEEPSESQPMESIPDNQ